MAVTPSRHLAGQLEADDLRREHVDRLAEHDRFRLDPADAPPQHAEPVDHRRVAISADQAIRIGHETAVFPPLLDDLCQILQVDLVYDTGGWRHDAEVVERLLTPLQELVTLTVPLELALGIEEQ